MLVLRTLKLLISIFPLLSQDLNTVVKIVNCFVKMIIIEKFDFERNAKKISGFEHIASKIRDIEKNILLNVYKFFLCSGLAADNPNFETIKGDWRERVRKAKKRASASTETEKSLS